MLHNLSRWNYPLGSDDKVDPIGTEIENSVSRESDVKKNHYGDWLMTNQFDLEHVEEEIEFIQN